MYKKTSFEKFKKEALKDPKIKAEYEALRPEFELIIEFIKARKAAKISQEDLAKKLKVKQPSIARLEGGGYTRTSIANLTKVANVLGYSLKISLQAKKGS
jgi:ribosome-binding protein aMBF1 (putative translation factor)